MIEIENENPALTAYRTKYYDGLSYPAMLARYGYAVTAIDIYYFGERRLILDSDLEEGINTSSKLESSETINKINSRNGQQECRVDHNLQDVGIT